MLKITNTTLEINKRFFQAIDTLRRQRKIRGLQSFAKMFGLNAGNLSTIKNNDCGAVKAEHIAILCREYGISPYWVLLGEGEMFRQTPSKTEVSPTQGIAASGSH